MKLLIPSARSLQRLSQLFLGIAEDSGLVASTRCESYALIESDAQLQHGEATNTRQMRSLFARPCRTQLGSRFSVGVVPGVNAGERRKMESSQLRRVQFRIGPY